MECTYNLLKYSTKLQFWGFHSLPHYTYTPLYSFHNFNYSADPENPKYRPQKSARSIIGLSSPITKECRPTTSN